MSKGITRRGLAAQGAAGAALLAMPTGLRAQAATLRFSSFEPPTAALTARVMVPWAEEVGQVTGGAVRATVFPGGALGRNPAQQLRLVLDGVADIAWMVLGLTPGRFDDVDVVALPFLSNTALEASVGLWRMLERNAFDGFDDLKVLGIAATPPVKIHARFPIRTVEDLRGKRLRVAGDHLVRVAQALGAVPVQMSGAQIAESLSRGVIDATLNNWGFVGDFRVNEVTSHHLEMPMGAVAVMIAMRRDRFESLPEQARAAIDRISGEALSRRLAVVFDEIEGEYATRIAASGRNTVRRPTDAEVAAWRAAIDPVNQAWRQARPKNEQLFQAFSAELGRVRQA